MEANNTEEKLFVTDRMLAALNADPDLRPVEMLKAMRTSVDAYAGQAPQFDDLTMLCLQFPGPAAGNE